MQSLCWVNSKKIALRIIFPRNAVIRSWCWYQIDVRNPERKWFLWKTSTKTSPIINYEICQKSSRLMEYGDCENINANLSRLNFKLYVKTPPFWFLCAWLEIKHFRYRSYLCCTKFHQKRYTFFRGIVPSIWKRRRSEALVKNCQCQSSHHKFWV